MFVLPRASLNTYWIVDPFKQVKSPNYKVKSKKNPSRIWVHFPICANMRVCTDKTGLSSITTCLTHLKGWMIGRSNDLEDVGRVASSFPTYLGKIEERLYWKCTVVVLQPGLTFVLYFRLWNPKYSSRNPESH